MSVLLMAMRAIRVALEPLQLFTPGKTFNR